MKFFIAFAALVAVAIASPLKPTSNEAAQLEAIIAAIHSPSTDPVTAALLEQQLQDLYGFHPIHVGPAIVETEPHPIHVGPAIVETEPHPIQVGPAVVGPVKPEPHPIQVGPAVVGPVKPPHPITTLPAEIPFPVFDEASPVAVESSPVAPSSPLVQIIVNVNSASGAVAPEAVAPVAAYPIEDIIPTPIHFVEDALEEIIPSPVHIVDDAQEEIVPSPVHIVDEAHEEIIPSPINIIEEADTPAEPIIIANPIVPIPVINIPAIIN